MKTISCDSDKALSTCPICGYQRHSIHCKHFVGFLNPSEGKFEASECIHPDFLNMPVSDRTICTTTENPEVVNSYWMDYETGIDPMTEGFKKLTREQAKNNDAHLSDMLPPTETRLERFARKATGGKVDMNEKIPVWKDGEKASTMQGKITATNDAKREAEKKFMDAVCTATAELWQSLAENDPDFEVEDDRNEPIRNADGEER